MKQVKEKIEIEENKSKLDQESKYQYNNEKEMKAMGSIE